MKKFVCSVLAMVLMLALCPILMVNASAATSNVWEAVESAPTKAPVSNVYPAYDPYGSSQSSTVEPSAPVKPATVSDNEGKTTETTTAEEKPTATQGIVVDDSSYSKNYVIKVDRTNQIITIFSASEPGVYNVIVKQFICSTGTTKNATPTGCFTLSGATRKEWRYFKDSKVYVRFGVHITGNYFFHSVLYNKPDVETLVKSSYRNLGKKASHGCIRMLDEDVKWMYDNCLAGTKVYVMDCQTNSALTDSLKPAKLA